jgi:hypothetical protein
MTVVNHPDMMWQGFAVETPQHPPLVDRIEWSFDKAPYVDFVSHRSVSLGILRRAVSSNLAVINHETGTP